MLPYDLDVMQLYSWAYGFKCILLLKQRIKCFSLYTGYVFTYTPPTMHHHGDQVVQPLRIGGVPGGVEEAEFQGEDDAIGQLGVALQLLHVFKALQVQS